jgi:hypothetical protein
VAVPRGDDDVPVQPVEISPLRALDAADLRGQVDPGLDVTGPVLIS